ncbi:MAG: reverse transcriptase family protein [Bacteroidota bacterium]
MLYYRLEEFTPPKEKITSWQLKTRASRFQEARTLPGLAKVLGMDLNALKNMVHNRQYQQFYIPKPKGGKRRIETPSKPLKKVLSRLNQYLQSAYYDVKPDCAYGCILATADEAKKRNIYTNALRHIKGKWLLSIDLEDFFNNISYIQIRHIFRNAPFEFNENSVKLLAELTTNENRLPIGAPTSPVLANLLCLPLDLQLEKIAKKYKLVYTRYLDDFSFSAAKKIKKKIIKKIVKAIGKSGFLPNTEKSFQCPITKDTHITGLSLHTGKPDVSEEFVASLESDIATFHKLTSVEVRMRNIFPASVLLSYRNSILGKLNFMKFIRGEGDTDYLRLKADLQRRLSVEGLD